MELIQVMTEELRKRCQCDFKPDLFSNTGLKCLPQSPNAATFHASLTGSSQVAAPQLVIFLEEWISSGALLTIRAESLQIDGTCAVSVPSSGESECIPQGISSSNASGGVSDTTIGIVAAVVVLVIVTLLAIIVLFVTLKLYRRNREPPQEPSPPPSS